MAGTEGPGDVVGLRSSALFTPPTRLTSLSSVGPSSFRHFVRLTSGTSGEWEEA